MARPVATALLLVDVQQDFFNRPDVLPPPFRLAERLAFLLEGARRRGWPVFQVRTRVEADGSGRMPHWVDQGVAACVAGTPGYEPPPALAANAGERVLHKRFFSGFDSPELLPALKDAGVEALVVAGLYTHGCIRATVLDAYAHGFQVLVAEDAAGSTEPLHAELSRAWLEGRAARFASAEALLSGGAPLPASSRVPEACAAAAQSGFAAIAAGERAALLHRWADALEREQEALLRLLADEIGKPRADESAGLGIFKMLKAFGLSEDAVCVDYGCGTLRVGLHAMRFLAPGAYWGLDISAFFLDQGRKLAGEKLIAEKKPNLRPISPATIAEAASHKPSIVFSIAVMFHVHPDELDGYVRNLMTLAGSDGKAIFSARSSEQTIHYKERCWSHSRKAIEAAFAAQGAGLEELHSESVKMPGFPGGNRYWFGARRV